MEILLAVAMLAAIVVIVCLPSQPAHRYTLAYHREATPSPPLLVSGSTDAVLDTHTGRIYVRLQWVSMEQGVEVQHSYATNYSVVTSAGRMAITNWDVQLP